MPGPKKQIVTLGAGFDTRYFNIKVYFTDKKKTMLILTFFFKAGNLDSRETKIASNLSKYIEIDFPEITMRKAMTIKRRKELSALLDSPENLKIARGGMDLLGTDYCLLGGDLRNWDDIGEKMKEAGLDLK